MQPRNSDTCVRIAYVINDLLLGGAQQAVLAVASGLDKTAYCPVVYYLNQYPAGRQNLESSFRLAGIETYYIGRKGKTSILRAIPRLVHRLRLDQPHIIHTHLTDATISGVIAAWLSGVSRIVMHEHQTHMLYSWKIRVALKVLRPFASLTIAYSPTVERELFGSECILREPIATIARRTYTVYNGIHHVSVSNEVRAEIRRAKREEMGIPQNAIVITTVGRLIDWKGHRELIHAFAQLTDDISIAHLLVVGEGPLRNELNEMARIYGLSSRVHLLGARLDVSELLIASDIGSLALVYHRGMEAEAVGMAGLEIMAAGIPLVASSYPAAHFLLTDTRTALLVPPGDTNSLAGALRTLITNPALRIRIGKEGQKLVTGSLTWGHLVNIYESIYASLIRS